MFTDREAKVMFSQACVSHSGNRGRGLYPSMHLGRVVCMPACTWAGCVNRGCVDRGVCGNGDVYISKTTDAVGTHPTTLN